jgi:CubicO group peptidase (beta-lactamase class C family)
MRRSTQIRSFALVCLFAVAAGNVALAASLERASARSVGFSQERLERAPTPGNAVGQGHVVQGPRKSFSGGAGLLSTATDYARFLQMLLNGGELGGRRILSRKSVELMTVSRALIYQAIAD